MKITMNDEHIVSIAQLQMFLKAVDGAVNFSSETKGNKNKQKRYEWIGRTLGKFRYGRLKKKEKGIVLKYLMQVTKLSNTHLKKLIGRKKKRKTLRVMTALRNAFPVRYETSDIARLIETDNAHGRISGVATKRILEREFLVFGKNKYERISHISVTHLYRIRKDKRQYQSQVLFMEKTKATDRNIAVRRKPNPCGKPGFLRVDTVHQGDLDKEKGVYHVNMVDEVTQWEIIGCVEGISEQFLLPLLLEAMERFPFVILGFHSDNGSEYVNHIVADLLTQLAIDQTKSRSRRTNDNALVEGKNNIVRKFMGHSYIQKKHARSINQFYREYMDDYLNFHRPCGFSTDRIDKRGKIVKVYDAYLTPYEKLISIPDFEQRLKRDMVKEKLEQISRQESDNECGKKMQEARQKLFKNFTR
jgi:transposase InsO family protein